MALIYGATGSTNITEIAARVADPNFPALLLIGGAMMIIGFGFKVRQFRFTLDAGRLRRCADASRRRLWQRDRNRRRFASFVECSYSDFRSSPARRLQGYLHESWINALTVMAMLTMTVGNIAAIVQNNVKRDACIFVNRARRLCARRIYWRGNGDDVEKRDAAIASVAFYMLTYAITNLGAFAIVTLLAQKNDRRTEFEDYNGIGLNRRFWLSRFLYLCFRFSACR
jgi:NADH-quinone oxidoreductase subunit N